MTLETLLIILIVAMFVLLIGFIPAVYVNQTVEGQSARLRRSKVHEAGLLEIFEPTPRLLPPPPAYFFPLALVLLSISIGVLLAVLLWVVASAGDSQPASPTWVKLLVQNAAWLRTLAFGFVGAYLFSVQVIARRYREGDLDPQVYFSVAERIIVALLIAGSLGLTYSAFAAPAVGNAIEIGLYIIAFTVGIFPESGMQWLTSLGRQWLQPNVVINKHDGRDYSLTRLPGLNLWQAFRLNLAGVEHIPDLAHADIQQLLRQTRFGIQQVYEWVDQAILYIHTSDDVWKALQAMSIRSFTDFQVAYNDPTARQAMAGVLASEAQPPAEGDDVTPDRQVKVSGAERLHVLDLAMQQTSNGDLVHTFWKYNTARATGAIRHYNLGQAYFELMQYDLAIENLNKALERADNDAHLYALRGDVWGRKGNFQKAIEDYDQSLQFDQQAWPILYQRGLAHMKLEHYAAAVEDFSRALTLDARQHTVLNSRGLAYQQLGQPDKAIADFSQAIDLAPAYAVALDNRGELHRLQDRTPEALSDLARALELDGSLVSAHYHLGLLRRKMGLGLEALDAFNRALNLKPDFAEAYNARGLVYQERRAFAQAIADFSQAISHQPRYAEAYNNRGIAYRLSGDLLLAYPDHTRAIELDERYSLAYVNRGITLLAAQEFHDALGDFDAALALDKSSAITYNHRGLAHLALDEASLALGDFDQAIELNKKYVEAYNNRGNTRSQLKAYKQAIEDFTYALSLSQNADIYLNRGNVYLAQAQFEPAVADYEKAIGLRYEFPAAHFNRGQAFVGLNQLEEALDSFKKASQFDPDHAAAFYRMARVAARLNRSDQALWALDQAVKLDAAYRTSASTDTDLDSLKALPRFLAILQPPPVVTV